MGRECPQCRYPAGEKDIRCPRCGALLLVLSCTGSCRACLEREKCSPEEEKGEKAKKIEKSAAGRGLFRWRRE